MANIELIKEWNFKDVMIVAGFAVAGYALYERFFGGKK